MDFAPPGSSTEYLLKPVWYTGRSLSFVSKYIYETSKPTRFQSVTVHNYEQGVMAFTDILEDVFAVFF